MMKNISALLFLGLILSMVSCGSDSTLKAPSSENTPIQTEATETEAETKDMAVYADLPSKDFGGMVFNILHYEEAGLVQTIHAEQMNGEPINDALYSHSLSVEQSLNIDIEKICSDINGVDTIVKECTAAGDSTYAVFFQHLAKSANLAIDGNCYPLNDIENFDFSKPWWKQSLMEDVSVGENVYMAFGDINLYTYESMTVMAFNKELLEEFHKESPYDLVDRNEWTFDNFLSILKDVKQDVNGNGIYGEDLEDIFALGGYPSMSFEAFFHSQGLSLVTKDENNIPQFNGMSDRYYDFYMRMSNLISDKDRVCYGVNFKMNFANGKQLFVAGPMMFVGSSFRDMEADFGVVPYPKADDEQAEYSGTITTQIQPVCIFTTNPDPEGTAIILENLAAESHRQVLDVYYNTLLENKYIRDEKSVEMIDMIYNSDIHIGLESIFDWSGIVTLFNDTMREGGENIISQLEKKQKSIQKQIDKMVNNLNSN